MIEIVQFVAPHNLEKEQNSNVKHARYIYTQKIALKRFILKKNDKRDLYYILIYIYLRFIRVVDILHYEWLFNKKYRQTIHHWKAYLIS